ncbi:DUF2235 domain-containing protein [Sphingobium sp. AP49]|uniref:DUF2235 domain-containing protein n=1 Tax=Sphingobium sp. AP49 TaxID=1144307 RepID=UPI00026ED37E|nr:DUF2235 domain-containing protein [Sphingobium sp. AP49]WHO38094.1 DUF2235 domain-containing protein [Sphingobium sp. AP49]
MEFSRRQNKTDMDEAAAAPELRADAPAPFHTSGKAIIVFSDGTGNSSGKLFKTNVFRLYQALDLGLDPAGQRTQIAYYDNGVGTSSVKLIAILGGIFGFGLRRNLLHLYRFICRNYNDGDKIYAFGFSRGAFTVRLLASLVCEQGIVPYEDERELNYNSADALYRFLDKNRPDIFTGWWQLCRGLRLLVRKGWRMLVRRPMNVPSTARPGIEFLGVWDTVAAYGGPISEITRGIDKYVWPLTMTDYELNPKVRTARHALALDDERDSFWPLLWDEVNEDRRANAPDADDAMRLHFRTRLKQVWFSGMHSDVGGGYPDESLSYVSLVWMMDEIGDRLRFVADEARRIRQFANPFGPMHDSRQGLGVYYRYQPRKISALLHRSVDDVLQFANTSILRDPTIGEKRHRPQGLLLSCKVHESVLERIGNGTDNYAPIVLPRDFDVVRAAGPTGPVEAQSGAPAISLDQAIANLRSPGVAQARAERQENAWDDVWRRRAGYFAVLGLSMLLIAAPLYMHRFAIKPDTDARWVVDTLFAWIGNFVPGFASPWYGAFRELYPLFLVVGLLILLIQFFMTAQSHKLSDRLRIAWWEAFQGQGGTPQPTRLRSIRNSRIYQRALQCLKWQIMPFLFGVGILALFLYIPAIIWSQVSLSFRERSDQLCASTSTLPAPLQGAHYIQQVSADQKCWPSGISVTRDHRYRVTIKPLGRNGPGWQDGSHPVPLQGQSSFDFPLQIQPLMVAGTPFRRVYPARWLEPLVEVRMMPQAKKGEDARARITIERMASLVPAKNVPAPFYAGEFTAPMDGELMLFLNDAVLPVGSSDFFYNGSDISRNAGTARICIEDTDTHFTQRTAGCGIDNWVPD